AFAAIEAAPVEPLRVRLAMPSAVNHKPKLQLSIPAPAQIEDPPPPFEQKPEVVETAPAVPPAPAPAKPSLWASLFTPKSKPKPERVLSARAKARQYSRVDALGYDEPYAPQRPSSAEAWRAMLSGWAPTASLASAMFAVLFLVSAFA